MIKNNLKIMLITVISLLTIMAACKKEECDKTDPNSNCYIPPVVNDPKQEQIAKLEKEIAALRTDSVTQLNAARAALEPALTQPTDIMDRVFLYMDRNPDVPHETFTDTVNYIRSPNGYPRVCELFESREWGTPNPETMQAFFDACDKYFATVEKLREKEEELNELKGGKRKD